MVIIIQLHHAGQAGVVVVEQAGFFLGFVHVHTHQSLGNVPDAAADRIPAHLGGCNGTRLQGSTVISRSGCPK
jgi:hypothetical protein